MSELTEKEFPELMLRNRMRASLIVEFHSMADSGLYRFHFDIVDLFQLATNRHESGAYVTVRPSRSRSDHHRLHYKAVSKDDDARRLAMIRLAKHYGRYGYRKVAKLLRIED